MYVNFEYYSEVYHGELLTEKTFAMAEQKAEDYIRYLTHFNGDIFADEAQADIIKRAVCTAADVGYSAKLEQEQGGNLKSESKDGLSVAFVVARKDGETEDDYVRRCMYQAIRIQLIPTGWLSRKVGYKHDHKCGCCDCL